MKLETMPIPCWACGRTYDVPAQLSLLPPAYMGERWYGKPASANVWVYVDRFAIAAHVAEHWPLLVVLFYWWKSVKDELGLDPLDYFA